MFKIELATISGLFYSFGFLKQRSIGQFIYALDNKTPEVTSKMILHFLKGRGERSLTWHHSISLISHITKTATYMMKRHIYYSCDYQYTARRFCEGKMHDPICLNKFAFSFLFPITLAKSIRSKLPRWYCSDSIQIRLPKSPLIRVAMITFSFPKTPGSVSIYRVYAFLP